MNQEITIRIKPVSIIVFAIALAIIWGANEIATQAKQLSTPDSTAQEIAWCGIPGAHAQRLEFVQARPLRGL